MQQKPAKPKHSTASGKPNIHPNHAPNQAHKAQALYIGAQAADVAALKLEQVLAGPIACNLGVCKVNNDMEYFGLVDAPLAGIMHIAAVATSSLLRTM